MIAFLEKKIPKGSVRNMFTLNLTNLSFLFSYFFLSKILANSILRFIFGSDVRMSWGVMNLIA